MRKPDSEDWLHIFIYLIISISLKINKSKNDFFTKKIRLNLSTTVKLYSAEQMFCETKR
jgi:hypothetical protein